MINYWGHNYTVDDNTHPFIRYVLEDKSKYKKARDCGYIDVDDDFLIDEDGGILMNIDFIFVDIYKFKVASNYYEEHGTYIDAVTDSPKHRAFRKTEEKRRKDGHTELCKLYIKDIDKYNSLPDNRKHEVIKPLRITGDHYNFINYGRIYKLDRDSVASGQAKKHLGFPEFIDSQYWIAKVEELAKNNASNNVFTKARRAGFSYWKAVCTANRVNSIPNCVVINAAYDKKYLTKGGRALTQMVRDQLNFYELYTPFRRGAPGKGLLKKDIEELILGYKDKSDTPSGWLSTVFSVSFGPNNPGAAIGKDAIEINVEELNDTPNLNAFMDVTVPTTRTGSYSTGYISGWGTAGSKVGNWANYENWFYNPSLYKALCFSNIWDENARHTQCGFYKPYIWGLEGDIDGEFAIDENGNSNLALALEISNKERFEFESNKDNTPADFIAYCGQHSNSPSESFSSSSTNILSSPELIRHMENVKINPEFKYYRDGMILETDKGLEFKTNELLKAEGHTIHHYIDNFPLRSGEDPYGCIREWYSPFKVNGKVPSGLYRVNYDPFAFNKDIDEISTQSSLACIQVWLNTNIITGNKGDRLVATYVGRPPTTEAADRIAMLLTEIYNGKLLVEVDRGDTVQNFTKWRKLHLLVSEPVNILGKDESKNDSYGVVLGSSNNKLDALKYFKEFLYTKRGVDSNGHPIYNFHTIPDYPFLKEITKWKLDGNFDRVSTALIDQFHRKELILQNIQVEKTNKQNSTNSIWNRARQGQWY